MKDHKLSPAARELLSRIMAEIFFEFSTEAVLRELQNPEAYGFTWREADELRRHIENLHKEDSHAARP